jgi:N4-gp56 family major capsid protein
MAKAEFGTNHPLAVKVWSKKLMAESIAATWVGKFIGTSKDSLLYRKDELIKQAGDQITYGLRMKGTGAGVMGDDTLEGQEEAAVTFSDAVKINQIRHAFRSAGKASEQRVPFEMRQENMELLRDWFAERYDTVFANQLTGNTAVTDLRYTGMNVTVAPSTNNIIRQNGQGSAASLTTTDTFSLSLVDACVARAKTMDQLSTTQPIIRPLKVGGEDKYVMFLHPWQVRDMRTSTTSGQWLDIQKAVTSGGEKTKNAIFTGALGEYNGVVLHEWTRLPLACDSTTTKANTRRAVFLGAQAACIAFGKEGGSTEKMSWFEELFDYGNQLGVSAGAIFGVKKSVFDSKDFATIVVETYAASS